MCSTMRLMTDGNPTKTLKGMEKEIEKHTTASIRWWSPTQLLIGR